MEQPELRLRGDRKKLYDLIKQGPGKDILPKTISQSLKSIQKQKDTSQLNIEDAIK